MPSAVRNGGGNSATRLASSPCRPSSLPLTFFPGGIERKAWERGYYQAIFNYLKGNIPRRVYQGRERISMQQQEEGSNNCGLYSIAAVYHAAKRDNIAAITFNENRMRSHLVHCFEHQKFTAFPNQENW